jgi:low temperature requirement protein LtrA
MSARLVESEHRVTPLELFFDLVFVFGFTQVTTLLHEDPSWGGIGRSVLVLSALWWAWASYAWLTNTVDAEDGLVLGVMLVAIAAMFIGALAVPEAFGEHRLIFSVAFIIVLLAFIGLFALAGKSETDLLRAVLHTGRITLAGALLIFAAGFVASGIRPVLWLAGLAVGLLGPLVVEVGEWRVHPAHFAERHGLIVIIAIGEALVAIGLGARTTALGAVVIVAALLGLIVAASLWLAYFDFFSRGMLELLVTRRGEQRVRLARDVYTYLHLPMIVGIVFFAFGMRAVLADVHGELPAPAAFCLATGPAIYLLAYVVMRWHVAHSLSRGRSTASILFLVLFPLALILPSFAALALVCAVWVGLHAYELIWWHDARAQRRAEAISDDTPAGAPPVQEAR